MLIHHSSKPACGLLFIVLLALAFSFNSCTQSSTPSGASSEGQPPGPPSDGQPKWMNLPAEEMPKAFMEDEDSNNDGKVTKDEFKGPDSVFAFFDKNEDGVIELSEAPTSDNLPKDVGAPDPVTPRDITINGVKFTVTCDVFTWATLPDDVFYERHPILTYTDEKGVTHYYETVYVSSGNLNWFQAAYLAQDAGGYLASINSEGENTFVFNQVSAKKYFWSFPEEGKHYGISIGPFLGGYQPEGSPEPDGGWKWLSGDDFTYTNWAVNLDDGVIDKDPRDNTQPNDSGSGQPIMGFGELNLPVATWGDYMVDVGTYGKKRLPGKSYGFIIEYEMNPTSTGIKKKLKSDLPYTIVDTDQTWCFSDKKTIECGEVFIGQDAQYEGNQPAYQDNGDGTITDLNTGLMWIKDAGEKKYYADAMEELNTYTFAGYDDWRLPTIKELYSLALFSGVDASMASSSNVNGLWPLIDTDYFVFLYGDESGAQRVIDAQWLTSSVYGSTIMNNQRCFFGFNFSDGRIKCYGLEFSPSGGFFAQYVRGGNNYGVNDFKENGDGTITDNATGLTWTQNDSGKALDWNSALTYCESLSLGGSDDWRLPNIKELHSIVDYSRSPEVTNSAAVDPIFNMTRIFNEAGQADYASYWSSTTLISYPSRVGAATYISFGRALGYQDGLGGWVDVHGAGAQRSDPKVPGEASRYEKGLGPQGDVVRQYNYTVCVRGGEAKPVPGDDPSTLVLSDAKVDPAEAAAGLTIGNRGPGNNNHPDLAAAAKKLGISEKDLRSALGPPPPDIDTAAEKLGVTRKKLIEALGIPDRDPESGGR